MQPTQYWKPGEARPKAEERGKGRGSSPPSNHSRSDTRQDGRRSSNRGDRGNHQHRSSEGVKDEGSSRKGVKGKGGGRGPSCRRYSDSAGVGRSDHTSSSSSGRREASTSPRAKGSVAGPSQGLLAMKFMQRKVKIDEQRQQQQQKRDKLERDFSSSFAKRLKADKSTEKDRLVCQADEQDPALVLVGRRSFGGFNAVAEAAYEACVRDIAASSRVGQVRGGADGDSGISDTEMAERLGKHMKGGRRRPGA